MYKLGDESQTCRYVQYACFLLSYTTRVKEIKPKRHVYHAYVCKIHTSNDAHCCLRIHWDKYSWMNYYRLATFLASKVVTAEEGR